MTKNSNSRVESNLKFQEDVTTKPKSRSPFVAREQILARRPIDKIEETDRIEVRQKYACSISWTLSNLEIYVHVFQHVPDLELFSDNINAYYNEKERRKVASNPGPRGKLSSVTRINKFNLFRIHC